MLTQLRRSTVLFLGLAASVLMACERPNESIGTKNAHQPPTIEPALSMTNEQKTALVIDSRVAPIPINNMSTPATRDSFTTVEWTDLMPKEDLDALLNPPEYITDIEDGSSEDEILNQLQNSGNVARDDRYQQALNSTQIVPEMNNKAIRIPGFVVPVEFDDDQTITQFFLVPFFGACLHLPPPPPNQIIFVNYPKGLKLEVLYDPFWVEGRLTSTLIKNEMATAAYSMDMQSYEIYTQ